MYLFINNVLFILTSTALTGILFPNHSISAYSAFRVWLALGFAVGFTSAELLSLQIRLWIVVAAVLLAFLCYISVEFTTQSKSSILPCYRSLQKKEDDFHTNENSKTKPSSPGISTQDTDNTFQNNTGDILEAAQSHPQIDTLQPFAHNVGIPGHMPVFECDSLDGTFPVGYNIIMEENSQDTVTQYNYTANTLKAVQIGLHKNKPLHQDCEEHHATKNMSNFECDSLDGTFPS